VRKITPPKLQYPAVPVAVKLAVAAANSTLPAGVPVLVDRLQPADRQNLLKRARAKHFSYKLAQELALCESRLQSSYYRTLTCCSELTQADGKLTAKYCGNRWCLVCCRIRTAKMLTKYEPHLEQMYEPHFVTLTIPNINSTDGYKELNWCITNMQKFCRRAFDRLRKYNLKFKGFRKIEITYSLEHNNYHPHIHFVSDGFISADTDEKNIAHIWNVWKKSKYPRAPFTKLLREYNAGKCTAGAFKCELLRQAWLKEFKHSRACAQDVRPARAGSLKELFKYSAKIVSKCRGKKEITIEPHNYVSRAGEHKTLLKKKFKQENILQVHVQALDKIYCALYGKRIIQPVGYTAAEAAEFNEAAEGALELEAQELQGVSVDDVCSYTWRGNDWIDNRTGCRLTGFEPNEQDTKAVSCFIFDTG